MNEETWCSEQSDPKNLLHALGRDNLAAPIAEVNLFGPVGFVLF